ncbi:uncharacterized protein EI90DRAFT_3126976 [Cantharellus anzutake]|uniref:uncharacterized protein n=1 Tax=Cantharellus anzutake TaxID=1750568 RepID=UPI0019086F88|nr:uncharacterized protein EI90DRAFT_3126976 [Cantharellus anzutake]KAF8327616.1 hypothetical protein EI90DRAFT_3126976 [Cantharellus anzutake]
MQSLRKKKLAKDGPRPRANVAVARSDARKSRVDDKIKKRMSMRYAEISGPTDIPDVPSVPPLPMQLRQFEEAKGVEDILGYRQSDVPSSGQIIDLAIFQQSEFNPDAYLKSALATSTEAELRNMQSSLRGAKGNAFSDMQQTVFNNYEEFVHISKEISTLENDMLELKEGLSEWKTMPALLNIEDTTLSRRANRSSVADLEKLYATQLSTLHMTIEGSTKFVPAIPGRHIVLEVENSWSLNPATYKVEYAVHFVLLDDCFLVAKRRRKRSGEGGKLVAERCWPLRDISVVDVKDSPALLRLGGDVTRAFKVRKGKDSFVYRCEKSSDKRVLLSTCKTTSEELAARRRKEREGEQERRRSLWTAGERASMYNVLEVDHNAGVSSLPVLSRCERGSAERAEVETQAVGDLTDDLTVAIALRRWGEAVEIVERGQKNLAALPSLAPKLTSLIPALTSALLHSLSDPSLSKSAVMGVTSLLLRLNEGIAARNVLLSARGSLIKKRTRMIAFEGEVSSYIAELAFVVFTSIKHTANWYLASFEENEMASTLIQWAREQIECFATMFKRQVNGPHIGQQDVDASILAMLDQNKKILHDNGMDFAHLLMTLIEPLALSSLTSVPLPSPSNASIPPLGSPQPPTLNISTSPLKLSNTSARAPSPLPSRLTVSEKSKSRSVTPDPSIPPPPARSRPLRGPGPRATTGPSTPT